MARNLYEEIPWDERKPPEAGHYITNLGHLWFNGKKFVIGGHKNPTPTIVEWWLEKYVP